MIIARARTTPPDQPLPEWQVTLANGETEKIRAQTVQTEGGALILQGRHDALVVAFGPGAWLEVQPT